MKNIPRNMTVASLGLALCLSLIPGVTQGQSASCGDFLFLLSPPDLSVTSETGPTGNRLRWTEMPADSTSCYDLSGDEFLPYQITAQGAYVTPEDRDFVFTALAAGVVGDRNTDNLLYSWNSRQEVKGEINGAINLSNTGGAYRFELRNGNGVAAQTNSGIPVFLKNTNMWAMCSWTDGTNPRIYSVVPGIPVLSSEDGGANWVRSIVEDSDPLAVALRSTNTTGVAVTVSPTDRDLVLVGTRNGIFRSTDGAISFERIGLDISSGTQEVTHLEYDRFSRRLFLSINGLGLFESANDGNDWTEISSLRVPIPQETNPDSNRTAKPVVFDLVTSPTDLDRIYVGLRSWGVYRTSDGGVTWQRADSNMVLSPGTPGAEFGRKVDIQSMVILEDQPQTLLASSATRGLFLTQDGADIWADVSSALPVNEFGISPLLNPMLQNPTNPDEIYAGTLAPSDTLGFGLLVSPDRGLSWSQWKDTADQPPFSENLASMVWHPTDPEVLVVGTAFGGIYEPGTFVSLSNTIDRTLTTDPRNQTLQIGVDIAFFGTDADSIINGRPNEGRFADTFTLRAEIFQGYAVWRAASVDVTTGEPNWELIGLYDVTNPEFCFSNPCDSQNPQTIPGCFADKRSNCFDLNAENGAAITFFDRDVFNGFTYWYAVSTFDYGFTGDIAPRSLARDMTFSPRCEMDSAEQAQDYLRPGNGNCQSFTVNVASAQTLGDVFVVPNPLRGSAGWDGTGESSVRWVNVTADANIEVFTLAGDLVRQLTPDVANDGSVSGNLTWDTKNGSGEEVASGVYIWRVTTTAGEELFGKMTIIR